MSNRTSLERQLGEAKSRLDAYGKGVAETERKDPIWRNLRAKVRQITNRLNALSAIEQRDADLAAAKAAAE